jgi:hypothetical protein
MKLVSYLTSGFIPGLEVLAHSLSHRGNMSGIEWLIITEDGELPGSVLKKFWLWGFIPTVLKMDEIGKDKWPDKWPDTRAHLYFNYNKLRILLLPPGEYFYLDTDLLCMNDAREMISMPSISGCKDQPHLNMSHLNLGVIRIDSNEALFDECVRVAEELGKGDKMIPLAEQTVLNIILNAHPQSVNWLPVKWNLPTNMVVKAPKLWRPNEAIFIHYMGEVKPWMGDAHWVMEKPNNIWRNYKNDNLD